MRLGTKYLMIRSAEGKTVKDFSEMCGISDKNYGEIERNEKTPSDKARAKIDRVVEILGWQLIDDGVVKKEKTYITFQGEDRILKLFDDIEKYVEDGGELLIDGADESKSPSQLIEKVKSLRSLGMKMRHLICEGDRDLRAPLEEYRWIPKHVFINQAIFIYKDNVAILSETEDKIFVHRDASLSRYFRNVFNERWNIYPQPDYSEAKHVFDV